MPLSLRDYQKEDVLEHRRRLKLLNISEMGTGKMVVGSRAIYEPEVYDARPALIAAPGHVCEDWLNHLVSEYPDDDIVFTVDMSPDEKRAALEEPCDWLLVTHMMLGIPSPKKEKARARKGLPPSPRNFYPMPKWIRSFVCDESHLPGLGRQSNAWLGAKQIADRINFGNRGPQGLVIPMTGTPIRKTADGLWSQLRLVDKSLTSYWRWVNEHCTTVDNGFGIEVTGSRPSAALELASRSIRRTYAEVGLELPDIVGPYESKVRLTGVSKKLYDRIKDELRDEENQPIFSAGAAVSQLRQVTAKDPNKVAKIREVVEGLDQYVVFVKYRDTAANLASILGATAISGGIPGPQRSRLAKTKPKLVCTIESMAASTDLSHHRDVIFYEEVYEPGTMDNALARVKRWRKGGGDAPVRLRYIYCLGTIDARIHHLVAGRKLDAESVTDRRLIREELHG